jgi:hypothetical protein
MWLITGIVWVVLAIVAVVSSLLLTGLVLFLWSLAR